MLLGVVEDHPARSNFDSGPAIGEMFGRVGDMDFMELLGLAATMCGAYM